MMECEELLGLVFVFGVAEMPHEYEQVDAPIAECVRYTVYGMIATYCDFCAAYVNCKSR